MARKRKNEGTRSLVLDTLKQMGARYEYDEDENNITFDYKENCFGILADDRSMFIRVYNNFVKSVDVADLDEVNRIRSAINEANMKCDTTFVFTVDETGDTMHVHIFRNIPFMNEIPELDDYLKTILNQMCKDLDVLDDEITDINEKEKEKRLSRNYGTRDIFIKTLSKMGCPYEIDENDDISFYYEGDRFLAIVTNDSRYVHIWHYFLTGANLTDVPAVSRMRKAINLTNMEREVTTAYEIDDEDKSMYVHSHLTIFFSREISRVDLYLKMNLKEFFLSNHFLEAQLIKLKVMEEDE